MTPDPFDPFADPVITAAVEQALEPYRDMVSPETFEEMRQSLGDFLVMHPVSSRMARSLRQRQQVKSGVEAVDGAAPDADEDLAARRKGA